DTHKTAVDYFNAMVERYPDRLGRTVLWATAQAVYGIRDNPGEDPVQFIANGDDDRMILPWYSCLTASLIPNAFVQLYPDSAHGFLYQHAKEFANDANESLNA